MQVYRNEDSNQSLYLTPILTQGSAVALGGFDAMHIGHEAIIRMVVEQAQKDGLTSVVYLFRNQSRSVITGEPSPNVCTFDKRLEILESWGVDAVVAEWFTPAYRTIDPETFVKGYLKNWLCAEFVAAGYDYRFGEKGIGDVKLLKTLCEQERIAVHEQAPVTIDATAVSSTRIRELLEKGNLLEAKACLGRDFSVCGTVIHGNHLGRTIGFPTANIAYPDELVLPKAGVYRTDTRVEGNWHSSITHFGNRPTVKDSELRLETHILDFQGDLYGREIEIRFCEYLREIKKFPTLEELKAQLNEDKKKVE